PILTKYREKISILPLGIFSQPKVSELRKPVDVFNLVYVGRIEKKKGIFLLVELMRKIKKPDIRLHIIGEGPYLQRLRRRISELNLDERIIVYGRIKRERLLNILTQSHVFLLLSAYESRSYALMEAISWGLVPIVTDVGGNRYVVDETYGYLVSYPPNLDTIKSIIMKLYYNRDYFNQKSRECIRRAVRKFNVKRMIRMLEEMYIDAMNKAF
ncbi:MAG: hypothetical protein DRP08_03325, partial [Candidatus Aenigmatarchaeota archaeon]